jgi:hypothetical protein
VCKLLLLLLLLLLLQTGTVTAAMLLETIESELDVKLSGEADDLWASTVVCEILQCISDRYLHVH